MTDMQNDRREQQKMLVDTAASFARRELEPGHLRGKAGYDATRWAQLCELGFTSLLLPDRHGGLGLEVGDMVPVMIELGRPLMREPLVPVTLAALAISAGGANAAESILEGVIAGTEIPALAWQEGVSGLPGAMTTIARNAGGGFVLSGRKTMVTPGTQATGYVVAAAGETGLFWVRPDARGVTSLPRTSADGSVFSEVTFDAVELPAEARLAEGDAALTRALDISTLLISAEMLGLCNGAFDMTIDYLKTRSQFGRHIGSFQALQHRAADLYLHRQVAAAVLSQTVDAFEATESPARRAILASRAKARLGQTAMRVVKEGVQMHGGIGFTDEHDIGLYLKRALVLQAWLGNAAEHRKRYAELTGQEAA